MPKRCATAYPQKLPNVPSEFLRKNASCSCCLVAPSSEASVSATAKQHLIACRVLKLIVWWLHAASISSRTVATAKQDLIACRNCVQTYPEKLPNVLSEFLEKNVLFLPPAAVVWWPQAASIRPPERTLHHSKAAPNFQTYPQNIRNVPSEFLDKMSFFCLLLFGGSKLQASSLQNGSFATAKQHLIAYRNRVQTYSRLVAPSCKHQASRTDPSPQQNST